MVKVGAFRAVTLLQPRRHHKSGTIPAANKALGLKVPLMLQAAADELVNKRIAAYLLRAKNGRSSCKKRGRRYWRRASVHKHCRYVVALW